MRNRGPILLRTDSFANVDFSLVKDTALRFLGEQGKLQFRAELFNVLNHANLALPSRTVFAGTADVQAPLTTAGEITRTLATSRQIQFAFEGYVLILSLALKLFQTWGGHMNSRAIKLLLVFVLVALPAKISAQSKPTAPFEPSSSLSDQEKRGKHIFLQRCSLCHLAEYTKEADWTESAALPPFGPRLAGLLKNATPEMERLVREITLKGTQKMPGFQYGLEPQKIDDLIAYMKTQ